MTRWLMYAGLALLGTAMTYTLYASVFGSGSLDLAVVPTVVLMLGIVLSIAAATLQGPSRRALRQRLAVAGCCLVAAYVTIGLSNSAGVLARDPSPANVFNALGMLGMLLALGGTAAQRVRA